MNTTACTVPLRPGLGRRLRDVWGQALAAHRRRREDVRMRNALSRLSDAGLRDLGLHRCEIDSLVAETRLPAEQRRPRVGRL